MLHAGNIVHLGIIELVFIFFLPFLFSECFIFGFEPAVVYVSMSHSICTDRVIAIYPLKFCLFGI